MLAKVATGKLIWERFNNVCWLDKQHRFSAATADGAKLLNIVQLIMSDTALTRTEVEDLCNQLNSRAVTKLELTALLERSPQVITLRNSMRAALNRQLYKHHAHAQGKRMMVWRCVDRAANGGMPLSDTVSKLVEGLSSKDTDEMPTDNYFFPGNKGIFNIFIASHCLPNICNSPPPPPRRHDPNHLLHLPAIFPTTSPSPSPPRLTCPPSPP